MARRSAAFLGPALLLLAITPVAAEDETPAALGPGRELKETLAASVNNLGLMRGAGGAGAAVAVQ
jgi:hypothetical protein